MGVNAVNSLIPGAYFGFVGTPEESAIPAAIAGPRCCAWCGYFPDNPHEWEQMLADQLVVWLVHTGGKLVERRFCIRCAPRELFVNLECVCCRDGPLVVGERGTPPALLTKLGERVLAGQGWSVSASGVLMCPRCRWGTQEPGRPLSTASTAVEAPALTEVGT
ncbi:hypothetical protein LX83_004428 [Goodfellowiella coeruleoviolacea]|uniref:Uncharacterized protein n=2 Tax=Goodfellowiella coeruleoviolacea TaxID=334858 RepID=A0AAE3KHN6_9PSEU|nr:hypothetical protein [Goodfellowiella coeruleoviolacea]